MILTGKKIIDEVKRGTIVISPFESSQVNPNSYNYRLGEQLKVFTGSSNNNHEFIETIIPQDGYKLMPGQMYLGHTREIIGSAKYAMSLIGKSSVGRLGLFLQVSANLGHTGSMHQWTLEIVALQPIIVYPNMTIGQVSFWENDGEIIPYQGKYSLFNSPQELVR